MPSAIASIAKQVQDVKAQSLSTLMATLEAVQATAGVGGNLANSPQATLQSVEAAIRAVIVEADPGGRALLQVAGTLIEVELPPELLRAAATNPSLLKPGTTVTLPAGLTARAPAAPATLLSISTPATGPSVGPAPPLANPFPAGTLGSIIARLTGIGFPQGEPAPASPQPLPALPPTIRPGALVQSLPPGIAEAMLRAAGRQLPLAPALTTLLTEAGEAGTTLPAPLAQAIRALQAARANPDALQTATGVKDAVSRSGLFLEANLAQGSARAQGSAQSQGAAVGQPFSPDLKSVLLAIRALLAGPELATAAGPATPRAPAVGLAARGVAPDAPRLPEMARAVEGALERVKLMQLASLPDHPEMRVTDDRAQGLRLALAIPFAPQGAERPQTAVMGLVIEHRPMLAETAPFEPEREAKGESETFPWKVRIALDLEETGPVQADVALRGQSVAVTLWAERLSVANLARDEIGALHEALTGAAFEVLKLEVRDGRPQATVLRAAPLVDRRT